MIFHVTRFEGISIFILEEEYPLSDGVLKATTISKAVQIFFLSRRVSSLLLIASTQETKQASRKIKRDKIEIYELLGNLSNTFILSFINLPSTAHRVWIDLFKRFLDTTSKETGGEKNTRKEVELC